MMGSHWRGAFVVGFGGVAQLLALTCAEPKPRAAPPSPVVVPPTGTSSTPLAAAVSSAPAVSAQRPPLVASTTPGKVQCGSGSCDTASEVCCISGADEHCVPKTGVHSPCGAGVEERDCDEAADCASGERCCHAFDYTDECELTELWRCSNASCGDMPDSTWELCLLGSSCPSGPCKQRNGESSSTHGYCPLDNRTLNCGNVTCGAGEACCWDTVTRTGRCVSDGECGGNNPWRLFVCQHASECDSGSDCVNSSGSAFSQVFTCHDTKCSAMTLYLGPYLCDSKSDCPPGIFTGDPPQELPVKGCAHLPEYPPGVKACRY